MVFCEPERQGQACHQTNGQIQHAAKVITDCTTKFRQALRPLIWAVIDLSGDDARITLIELYAKFERLLQIGNADALQILPAHRLIAAVAERPVPTNRKPFSQRQVEEPARFPKYRHDQAFGYAMMFDIKKAVVAAGCADALRHGQPVGHA